VPQKISVPVSPPGRVLSLLPTGAVDLKAPHERLGTNPFAYSQQPLRLAPRTRDALKRKKETPPGRVRKTKVPVPPLCLGTEPPP